MAKIRVNGEVFDWDSGHHPMSEALAIEQATGLRYVDWESELAAGSMRAMCGFVWLVWRRNGRDVPYTDITDGKVEIDLTELLDSLMESRQDEQIPDPTEGAPLAPTVPAPTPTTGTSTSPSSPSTSGSGRGRSGS